ncbi:cupin domain-containing protein [Paenibacillus hodogayensis]|uniref:Cupin domain-containing protein n=1 Tax=Paenibacillus hodogayensis TaxID=279208 RepID=A0ABV5VP88_9BACL
MPQLPVHKEPFQRMESFEGTRFPFRCTDVTKTRDGYLVFPHWHRHIEIIRVLQGPVQVTLANKMFTAFESDIIYIGSGQVHAVQTTAGSPAHIRGVVFDPLLVTNLSEGFDSDYHYLLYSNWRHTPDKYSDSHPLWEKLNALLISCQQEYVNQDIGSEVMIRAAVYQIATALLRDFHQNGRGLQRGELAKATAHIWTH